MKHFWREITRMRKMAYYENEKRDIYPNEEKFVDAVNEDMFDDDDDVVVDVEK